RQPRRLHSFPTRRSSDLSDRPSSDIFMTPGNAGTEGLAINIGRYYSENLEALAKFARDFNLTVYPGQEKYLEAGLVDYCQKFGVDRKSTRLNSSHSQTSY